MNYRTEAETTILKVKAQRAWNSSNITAWSIVWLMAALLAYFLFSTVDLNNNRPLGFKIATYLFTDGALLGASLLCYRNWRQQKNVPSGRWIWLLFSIGIFSYLIGEIILSVWELWWGFHPEGSPADFAFIGFYLFMISSLGWAITRQRLTMNWQQGLILLLISALATGVTLILTDGSGTIAPQITHHLSGSLWAEQLDRQLKPLAPVFNVFYILADMVLIILASILSLGFWGGRLGKTWQVVAQGITCLYLADIRFAYLAKTTGYESGDLMEIFWIAGMLQLGIAAAMEWENSHRLKRLMHR